jgi:secreted trypsin-like serine protease
MRCSWVALTGLAVAAGCQAEAPSASRQAIVAGMADTGDPAIMEMLSFRGNLGARCTATLVTPRILVLAAHCFVETSGFNQRFVFPGNDDRNVPDKDLIPIKTFAYDERYTTPRQGHDFAVIVLDAPMTVKPMRLNRAPANQGQGKMVRYVGYGQAVVGDPQSGGVKRQNSAPLATVSQLLLSVAPNAHGACEGDSGGPLLLDDGQGEALIGVASFVTNPACLRDSFYQRVDTQLAWLDEQLAKYDPAGMAPAADGGAGDVASAPDAGVDRQPEPQAPDAAAPATAPTADARPRDVAPSAEPEPTPGETPTAKGASGGCSQAGGAGGSAGWLLLALAFVRRRSR